LARRRDILDAVGRSICLLWIVTACYTANPAVGLPCSESGNCPEGQSCDFDTLTCVKTLPAMQLQSIASGYAHTCGIDAEGGLWCWGLGALGELGLNDNMPRAVPTRVGTDKWKSVVAGDNATCGIRTDGTLWCWGDSQDIGTGAAVPTQLGAGTKWQAASVAEYQLCAIDSGGDVWCLIGNGSQLAREPMTHATAVAAGGATTPMNGIGFRCAIDDNQQLWCWGLNAAGQIGDGTFTDATMPYAHPGKWESVAAGVDFACAIDSDSHLWCWGSGYAGQNGQIGVGNNPTPTQIGTDTYSEVSVGGLFVCAVRADHAMVCFGNNLEGELGAVTIGVRSLPVEMPFLRSWETVAAGGLHACALDINKDAWCWGWNRFGQLGNGEIAFQATPAMVDAGPWTAVSTGLSTTCAVRDDHTAWCWGENGAGQLGDGTTMRHAAPNQVGSDSDWQTISTGRTHTCGIRMPGLLYCWGDNRNGELGQGGTSDTPVTSPAQVGSANDWTDVSAAGSSTIALEGAGLFYWGGSKSVTGMSQIATGTYSSLTGEADNSEFYCPPQTVITVTSAVSQVDETGVQPIVLTSSPSWKSVSQGFGYYCGISSTDNTVQCWGSANGDPDSNFQLGVMTDPPPNVVKKTDTMITAKSVAAGKGGTCAIGQDDGLYCWGTPYLVPVTSLANSTPTPQHVIPGTSWLSVSLSYEHGCAIQMNGSLWCWGDNLAGELGTGPAGRNRPVRVTKEGP
jgi:alpha-tubulin suppressor-like RCC1 family protein